MQRHRAYIRKQEKRHTPVKVHEDDAPVYEEPEMKHGDLCVGDTGLTNDEFMQAIAEMEAAGGWDKYAPHPPEPME
jgi:hypothetical protein